ncbi:hypothetical protein GTA09_17200 [Rhodococcus hoagii]|nr:hypothetical protein [Prescottella equi]
MGRAATTVAGVVLALSMSGPAVVAQAAPVHQRRRWPRRLRASTTW